MLFKMTADGRGGVGGSVITESPKSGCICSTKVSHTDLVVHSEKKPCSFLALGLYGYR